MPAPALTVRRLPEEVHSAIKAEAAAEGISAEEKVRRVLTERFGPETGVCLGDYLQALAERHDLPEGGPGDGPDFERIRGDAEPPTV